MLLFSTALRGVYSLRQGGGTIWFLLAAEKLQYMLSCLFLSCATVFWL